MPPADDQVALGFTRLLAGLDDLALDIPDAAHLLELFVGEHIAARPRTLWCVWGGRDGAGHA